jgi:hypothetical protein
VDETSKSPMTTCCTKYLDGVRTEVIYYAKFSGNEVTHGFGKYITFDINFQKNTCKHAFNPMIYSYKIHVLSQNEQDIFIRKMGAF